MQRIYHNFVSEPGPPWRCHLRGSGALESAGSALRLVTGDTTRGHYTDAQVDDYQCTSRPRFLWRAPLRMMLRARFSHPAEQLRGTAGFGFWNYPVLLSTTHLPTLPRALWFFFGSPPCNLKLDHDTPGSGWKAATIDTLRPAALALAPLAPLAVVLMNSRPLYRLLWPRIQRALAIREAPIQTTMTEMTDWHIYTIDWGITHTDFLIDGKPVLQQAPSPGGPLCFVTWIDNQYAIVTPWGQFGWGLLDIPGRQWIEIDWLAIERQ